MKSLLLTITALLFLGCSSNNLTPSSYNQSSQTKAILKLDTKGHTAMIGDIIVTKSGDIISASDDKSIRVWDSTTGKEKRKILGQIGSGSGSGEIYALALSPNEEFLAVGGFLGKGINLIEIGKIRIYNYKTGKVLKVLKSHTNSVLDLAFSNDGKYLISGSGDNTAKIWQTKNFELIDTIKIHTNEVYGVGIINNKNDYHAVTVGFDNKIVLYNIKTKKVISTDTKPYKLNSLAISKEHIAICGKSKEINIYNHNLKYINTIHSKTIPSGLAYSSNGVFLIAGFSFDYRKTSDVINIYNTNKNYQKIQSFKKHKNLVYAVSFLDNQKAISSGGDNFEIYIWDIPSAKVLKKIIGVGSNVWSVDIKGNSIMWGNINDCSSKDCSKLQKFINLKILDQGIKPISQIQNSQQKRVSTTSGSYNLSHSKGGNYGYDDGVLNIKKNNKTITSIIRDASNGVRHNCYIWYQDYIISGGMNGALKIYNKNGKEIASLVGHTGEVWSIAVDGDKLVSGSSDQTIIIWNLKKLILKNKKQKFNKKLISKLMKKLNWNKKKVIWNLSNLKQTIQPQLTLFISKTNDWIAWTPQGYYNASKGAEKYIGYHINQGDDKEARFLDISRFKKQFYRPDLITKAINGEDISSYTKDINIDALLNAGLPPKVNILTNSPTIDKNNLKIKVNICNIGGGFDNLNFYVDGKPIKSLDRTKALNVKEKVVKNCTYITQQISIPSGKHIVSFDATNREGNIISNRPSITVTNTKKIEKKPNLHLFTLTLNEYKDSSLNLKFSNNDAKELGEKLKIIGKPIFENIYTYALKDSQVTKEHIDKKMKEIAPKVDVNDVFILYMSGHGITSSQNGDYYFIPYDYPNGADLNKAINQDRFKKIMSQIKAVKSVILIDTCESGSMASTELINTSIKRFGGNVGSAIIAGATSRQKAIDGYKKHGIFTYTILDAMDNKEVYSFDDKLSINEVAEYTKYLLPKLAKEKFGHKQNPAIYMNGDTTFAIGGI